ncbi:MAG: hypothetical protein JSW71_08840 [Gemmatimonadota bacterium]|nr:MAG: hypothetical protein JSW71_08840 [Gemmatimonadota bacterium]
MLDGMKNSGQRVLDPLGRLCFEGHDVANYLFQVPDDASQWERLQRVVDAILAETAKTKRKELPAIAMEMREVMQGPPSAMAAEQLVSGFDRMIKLWKSAKSGLMNAEELRKLGN